VQTTGEGVCEREITAKVLTLSVSWWQIHSNARVVEINFATLRSLDIYVYVRRLFPIPSGSRTRLAHVSCAPGLSLPPLCLPTSHASLPAPRLPSAPPVSNRRRI
jgi:hypothetical protein